MNHLVGQSVCPAWLSSHQELAVTYQWKQKHMQNLMINISSRLQLYIMYSGTSTYNHLQWAVTSCWLSFLSPHLEVFSCTFYLWWPVTSLWSPAIIIYDFIAKLPPIIGWNDRSEILVYIEIRCRKPKIDENCSSHKQKKCLFIEKKIR